MERDFRGEQLDIFNPPQEVRQKEKQKLAEEKPAVEVLSDGAETRKILLLGDLDRMKKLPDGICNKNLHELGLFRREYEDQDMALQEIGWINKYVGKDIVGLRIKQDDLNTKYMITWIPIASDSKADADDSKLRNAA